MSAYDMFRKEFDKMSEKEKLDLGLSGLVAMHQKDGGASAAPMRRSKSTGLLGDDWDKQGRNQDISNDKSSETTIIGFDNTAITSLVDRMKRETYKVTVTNMLSDLVEPFGYKLDELLIRSQIFDARMHSEHFLYYRSIISSIKGLGTGLTDTFIESMVLQYRNFMRHPVWNTLKVLTNKVIIPLYTMTDGILFGFKKKESDTDRIVNAIERQTEFQRTGKIEDDSNSFSRLFRTGIVKSMGRSLLDTGSGGTIGIGAAQAAQEKKGRGEELTGKDKMSLKLFGKYTDVFDERQEDTTQNDFLLDELVKIREWAQLIHNASYTGFDRLLSFHENAFKLSHENALAFIQCCQAEEEKRLLIDHDTQLPTDPTLNSILDLMNNPSVREQEEQAERDDRMEDIAASVRGVKGNTEQTTEELDEHNKRETRRSIFGFIGGGLSALGSLGSLGGLLAAGGLVIGWNKLPDSVKEDITNAVSKGFVEGMGLLGNMMDGYDWVQLVSLGLMFSPIGVALKGIAAAIFVLTTLVEGAAEISDAPRVREQRLILANIQEKRSNLKHEIGRRARSGDSTPEEMKAMRANLAELDQAALVQTRLLVKTRQNVEKEMDSGNYTVSDAAVGAIATLIARKDGMDLFVRPGSVDVKEDPTYIAAANELATMRDEYEKLGDKVHEQSITNPGIYDQYNPILDKMLESIEREEQAMKDMERSLERNLEGSLLSRGALDSALQIGMPSAMAPDSVSGVSGKKSSFYKKYKEEIEAIASQVGVSPRIIAAKLALETGWGESVIPGTNNLGNIKAGKNWDGKTKIALDQAEGSIDAYRVYDDPEAFAKDYVSVIKRNFPDAVGTGNDVDAFSAGLNNGKFGSYATDPHYWDKLRKTVDSVVIPKETPPTTILITKPYNRDTTSSLNTGNSRTDKILYDGFSSMTTAFMALAESVSDVVGQSQQDQNTASLIT